MMGCPFHDHEFPFHSLIGRIAVPPGWLVANTDVGIEMWAYAKEMEQRKSVDKRRHALQLPKRILR